MTDSHDVEFNPLTLESIGKSVVYELMKRPVHPLPPEDRFRGSGVYAIYYSGTFPPYAGFQDFNDKEEERFAWPLYVGKAVPKGSRKGETEFRAGTSRAIWNRLNQHSRSIDAAKNIELSDFRCRYLVVAPVWIRLAESLITIEYRPLWNVLIDGFGNHDPGKGRYNQERSRWDELHPGRPWANRLQQPTSFAQGALIGEVKRFLAAPPPAILP